MTATTTPTTPTVLTANMNITGVVIFGLDDKGQPTLFSVSNGNGNALKSFLQPAPQIAATPTTVLAEAPRPEPTAKIDPKPKPAPTPTTDSRDVLMQKIKAAGGSCKGLGRATPETLAGKLAELVKNKAVGTAPQPAPAPVTNTAPTATAEPKKNGGGGGKPGSSPMKVELVSVVGCRIITIRTKKGKEMQVYMVEDKGAKVKVFNPAKSQEGAAPGYMLGSCWMVAKENVLAGL